MKRNIITLVVVLFVVLQTMGQTYDNLWKQATSMRNKDLPKSEMVVLKKIADKATVSKDYGQLLAAEMRQVALWNQISSDSLGPAIKRLEVKAAKAQDPMLKAVWYASLGKLCRENPYDTVAFDDSETEEIENVKPEEAGSDYFMKALANPGLLASHTSTEYVPLTLKGMDGASFNNDMLHLIGFEAGTKEAFQLMYTYYNKVGNRGAACLCAFEITQKDRQADVNEVRKSKYLNTIDSLIHVYQDIPEAGELAVEHFRFMEGATDAKPQDKLNYINYALNRWGGWSRMNVLRNAQKRLTEPMFSLEDFPIVIRPNQKQWLQVRERNLQSLKMTISRINITADNDYDVDDEGTYKLLLSKTTALHQKDFMKSFYGHPNYEVVKDSFEIAGLPLGAYLLEISSDNTSIKPERCLFYVSDLALMKQQLPDDSHRYVVVSATTGQPIAGAKILLYERNYNSAAKKDKRTVHARLTTDENGEAYFKNVDGDILVTTDKDKYTPSRYIYLSRGKYYEPKDSRKNINIYTDRAIYRPGQTVHASAVCWQVDKGVDAKALAQEPLNFVLRDANFKVLGEKSVTSDEYGSASVDFELPQGGLTGVCYINIKGVGGYCDFRVEEYKRPTFEITFPDVNQKYTWGDTVVVKGTAKTYAGIPVQGAKVSYSVTRRNQLWWWEAKSFPQHLNVMKGEGITREDGTFDVEIPLVAFATEKSNNVYGKEDSHDMNEFMRKARFFSFDVKAVVTDQSGESHQGGMSLPLGTRPTVLSVDLPQRVEKDSLETMTLNYRNASGMEISGEARYRIDGGEWQKAATNEAIDIKKYPVTWTSGVHHLEAICEQDTLKQKFTLFSMADTHPMEKTTHWSYQTSKVFPRDGKPVYVQVGSSENGVHIVYSIIAGNKLLEKGAWELGDSIVTLPFTYRPEYATGVVINYAFVKEGVCYTEKMTIARPLPEKKLNVAWKSFRNRLTPGQKEEWTLNITTPDGKPAKAQLLSVLYDKSIDQIAKHTWNLSLGLYQSLPNCYWRDNLDFAQIRLSANYPTKYYEANELEVDKFVDDYFSAYAKMEFLQLSKLTRKMNKLAAPMVGGQVGQTVEAVAMSKDVMYKNEDRSYNGIVEVAGDMNYENQALDQVQLRENFNETAFFYPALESDDKGNVSLKFTLPESITTWKFMGLAHDKDMRNGMLVDEAVAKKVVMVQPNLPRFLREGDKATLVTKVFNTSDRKVSGEARMQILDPETNRVVWQKSQKYQVDANGTATVSFNVEGLKEGVYINKVVAAGNGYSDGEQHYLPVLSDKELVVNTLPITLHEKGNKDFDLSSLFVGKDGKQVKNADHMKVTVEYTNNPSWLMIQALPSISNPVNDDNAISLMSAIYSNSIARHIMSQNPVIKQVVEVWKKENGNHAGESLKSSLEKNQELKTLVLSETPWVMDADKENEQKSQLVNYFDESMNAQRLTAQIAKLKALQNTDGSFSWWKGMSGSRYMTTAVAEMMVRLNKMVGVQTETAPMLTAALNYLQTAAAKEVKNMKKQEAKLQHDKVKRLVDVYPSEEALDYLYILALDGRKLNASASSDKGYLLKKMVDRTCEFTIYGKAQAAVVLAYNGYHQKASEYLQSILEYSVYKPEMGRYFDTKKAYYSWSDYKIPTQVAAIEAFQLLADKNITLKNMEASSLQAIEEYQRWLLQSKRTQSWSTPINAVNAVYAFMNGKEKVLEKTAENANIKLDGKNLSMPKATVGLGYVKTSKEGSAKLLTIEKKNEGTSWGAVYAQFTFPSADIASSASGIKVFRKVVETAGKAKVVLTITADRDYDFVQVVDKRAACLEPVNQLSGYQWGLGCYVAPHDYATNYYFDRLSKGKHTLETEYYVDREGEYQSGTCSIQCAYSPEFGGRAEAYQMKIKK